MLFAMVPCASGDRKAASQRWREHRRCVVYNPCYWCCWLPTMLLIVVGRWLHFFFGQHMPLREPEHERALLPPLRRQLLLQFAVATVATGAAYAEVASIIAGVEQAANTKVCSYTHVQYKLQLRAVPPSCSCDLQLRA